MATTNPPRPRLQARFDTLLVTCRDKVLTFTDAQLSELFNHTDQALLDFAEKAESNAMQGRFFDAMGEVRKQRSLVEQNFREQVKSAFDLFGQWDLPGFASATNKNVDLKQLSLVAHDDVEESVAIENIIFKARTTYYEELYALSQRLAVINGGRKLKERTLPSGPHHLAGAFQSTTREIKVDPMIKLILFALFEKYVMVQAKSVYDEFNADLIAAGILPDLKPALQHDAQDGETSTDPSEDAQGFQPNTADGETSTNPSEDAQGFQSNTADGETTATTESDDAWVKSPVDAYTGGESTGNLGEELLSTILSLMAVQRGQRGATRRKAPAHPVPTASLVSAIERIQPAHSAYNRGGGRAITASPHMESDQVFRRRIRDTLAEDRQRLFAEVNRDQMNALDADTIDLVGMLFEFMLDDPNLPNVAKALISHLHTPYLKVAIIDRQLLTDDEHPARSLLDELIEAGSEWVYEHDLNRGIFPAMKTTVDRVLKEFSDNGQLFDGLLADFRSAVNEQKHKAGMSEKRSQEAAKEREKLEIARQRAEEVTARAHQPHLPQVAVEFLTQCWSDKLIFILLRHPDAELSNDWTEALRIADDLIRVFEPTTSPAVRRALAKVLCLSRESIEDGLNSVGDYQAQCAALFRLLESPESLLAEQETLPQDAASKRSPNPLSPQEPQSTTRSAATEPVSQPQTKEELTPIQEAILKRLLKVNFGTWFEFRDQDSSKTLRLRLSWFSPQTMTCMFVNSAGVQAALKTMPDLAREITDGRAKLIERTKKPFVERTLKSIRNMLLRGADQVS